ncbi:MAG: hypothetical protein ACW98Y_20930 [Candidatus Thorarchaeota archaeon]|jgi:hypothetical protein
MSLAIYSAPYDDNKLTGTNTTFTMTFDGRVGGIQDRRIYIRNDETIRWYENITLSVIDYTGDSIVDGTNPGFYWKLMEKDIIPTNEEWDLIASGNTLSLSSDLGSSLLADIVTYLPVWIRVAIPRGQSIQTIKGVILRISATEGVVSG